MLRTLDQVVKERVTAAKRAFSAATVDLEPEMEEMAQGAPELAAHERARVLKQKVSTTAAGSTKWGICGADKTAETKVPIEERIKTFPDQSLQVAPSSKGKVLFCQCCPKTLQNLTSTIKVHIGSQRHK